MPVSLKSSEVQQNFGLVMDRAMTEAEVIVERYGMPRVVILDYRRYQQLLAAERDLLHAQLQQASAEVSARAAELTEEEITALIEEAREAVHRERADS